MSDAEILDHCLSHECPCKCTGLAGTDVRFVCSGCKINALAAEVRRLRTPAVPVKRFDDAWCEHCLRETTHLTYRAAYGCAGRDDWRECCDCRWRWRAAVGRYEAPTLEDVT